MLVDDDNKQEHIRLRTRRFNYDMSNNFVVHQHMEYGIVLSVIGTIHKLLHRRHTSVHMACC